MSENYYRACNGSFTLASYYAIAIAIKFKNVLCTHFCDCNSYSLHRKNRIRNGVVNLRCELTLTRVELTRAAHVMRLYEPGAG